MKYYIPKQYCKDAFLLYENSIIQIAVMLDDNAGSNAEFYAQLSPGDTDSISFLFNSDYAGKTDNEDTSIFEISLQPIIFYDEFGTQLETLNSIQGQYIDSIPNIIISEKTYAFATISSNALEEWINVEDDADKKYTHGLVVSLNNDLFIAYSYKQHNGDYVPVLYKTDMTSETLRYFPDRIEGFYYNGTVTYNQQVCDVWTIDTTDSSMFGLSYLTPQIVEPLSEELLLPPVVDNASTGFDYENGTLTCDFYYQADNYNVTDFGCVLANIAINGELALKANDYVCLGVKRAYAAADLFEDKFTCEVPIAAFKDKFLENGKLKLNSIIDISLASLNKNRTLAFKQEDLTQDIIFNCNKSLIDSGGYDFECSSFGSVVSFYPVAAPELTLTYSTDLVHDQALSLTDANEIAAFSEGLIINGVFTWPHTVETDTLSWYSMNLERSVPGTLRWEIVDQIERRAFPYIADSIITEDTIRNRLTFTSNYNFFKDITESAQETYRLFLSYGTKKGLVQEHRILLRPSIIPHFDIYKINPQYLQKKHFFKTEGQDRVIPQYFERIDDDEGTLVTNYYLAAELSSMVAYSYSNSVDTTTGKQDLDIILQDEIGIDTQQKYRYIQTKYGKDLGPNFLPNVQYDKWQKDETSTAKPHYTLDSEAKAYLYTKSIVQPLTTITVTSDMQWGVNTVSVEFTPSIINNGMTGYLYRKTHGANATWELIHTFSTSQLTQTQRYTYTYTDTLVAYNVGYTYKAIFMLTQNGSHIYTSAVAPMVTITNNIISLWQPETLFLLPHDIKINNITHNIEESIFQPLKSQFPIWVRNSHRNYRTFTISASLTREDLTLLDQHYTTIKQDSCNSSSAQLINSLGNLLYTQKQKKIIADIDDEIYLEQQFRNALIEFFNTDSPTLLKTATEGNLFVKINNVTFTPKMTLGNKIYDIEFSVTEIEQPANISVFKTIDPSSFISPEIATQNIHSTWNTSYLQQIPRGDSGARITIEEIVATPHRDVGTIELNIKLRNASSVATTGEINIYRFDMTYVKASPNRPTRPIKPIRPRVKARALAATEEQEMTVEDDPIFAKVVCTIPAATKNKQTFSVPFTDIAPESGKYYCYCAQFVYQGEFNAETNIAALARTPAQSSLPAKLEYDTCSLATRNLMLQLAYNLQITNIVHNNGLTITPTLNGQYPFVHRSNKMDYRTFSISADLCFLLEHTDGHSAEEVCSWDSRSLNSSLVAPYDFSHSLFLREGVNHNIDFVDYMHLPLSEQMVLYQTLFREKAIKFLHQDEIYVLKSPFEGNIFIRLQDITLTPRNDIGPEIYTFSATAIEILPNNRESYWSVLYQQDSIFSDYGDTNALISGHIENQVISGFSPTLHINAAESIRVNDWSQKLLTDLEKKQQGYISTTEYIDNMQKQATLTLNKTPQLETDSIDPLWGDEPLLHGAYIYVNYDKEEEGNKDSTSADRFAIVETANQEAALTFKSVNLYRLPKATKGGLQ